MRTIYQYETSADGLCEYTKKRDAIRSALAAGAAFVTTERGKIVWRNPRGGERNGELCDSLGTPLPLIHQTPLA
jgi:hypothetical protein